MIVYEHPDTGELIDMDGRVVEPDTRLGLVVVPSDEEIKRVVDDLEECP